MMNLCFEILINIIKQLVDGRVVMDNNASNGRNYTKISPPTAIHQNQTRF